MAFDDYNYTAFNQYVLVVEPEDSSKALDEMEQRLSLNKQGTEGQSERKELTNTDLNYIDETSKPFTQDAITLPPTKFELEKEQEPLEEQKPVAVVQKKKNQSDDESDKKSLQGTEKREKEAEDKYKDFMYNMYFEPSEIDKI